MERYRITKYNPAYRNLQGNYTNLSEWTSISDIGKPEFPNFTFDDYEKTETAYVNAVLGIMHEHGIKSLTIDSLEWTIQPNDFEAFKVNGLLKNLDLDFHWIQREIYNGRVVLQTELDVILRLILREVVWMNLVNEEMEVQFGYDYYMYVRVKKLNRETIQKIEESGLFVEFIEPRNLKEE